MKRIISFVLVLCMLIPSVLIAVSCGDKKDDKADNGSIILTGADAAEYIITRPDNAGSSVKDAVVNLKKAIKTAYDVDISIKTDYIPRGEENPEYPEYEIVIGKCNRPENEGILEGVDAEHYIIKAIGKKIFICAESETMTAQGVSYFIKNIVNSGEAVLSVKSDYEKTGVADFTYCSETGKTYEEMAREVYASFLKKYWRSNWVEGSGFWDAAEILETFIDAYDATEDAKYLDYAEKYAASFITKHGRNWLSNEFNDDIMWITIAYLRLYKITDNRSYYTQAKSMFDGVYKRAWSDDLGGGLFWKNDNKTKNSCVNCPGAIAACLIAESGGGDDYIVKAKAIIDWVVLNLYETNGHVYDSYPLSGEKNKWASTYNQGTFIGACTLIYRNTKEDIYKGYADAAVQYTKKNMFNDGMINAENDGNDLQGFKGILTRWMKLYAMENSDVEILSWLQLNARTAYSNQNKNGLIWTNWSQSTDDRIAEGQNVFGFSTAVALMFNSVQWWESESEE